MILLGAELRVFTEDETAWSRRLDRMSDMPRMQDVRPGGGNELLMSFVSFFESLYDVVCKREIESYDRCESDDCAIAIATR